MEVRGQQPDPARDRFEQQRQQLAQNSRARSREAREALTNLAEQTQAKAAHARSSSQAEVARQAERQAAESKRDRIELSEAARAHAEALNERSARVAELKAAHEAGELNTPERIEQAATNLLEG